MEHPQFEVFELQAVAQNNSTLVCFLINMDVAWYNIF